MIHVLVTPDELDGERIVVEGDAYRHFFRARRARVGDEIKVVDGAGRARWGRVETVDRRRATMVTGAEAPTCEPAAELHVWTALSRPERASLLVEKCTEIGVSAFHWFSSDRSQTDWSERVLERLERVAAAAVEQCGRARLPPVRRPTTFDAMLGALPASSVLLDFELRGRESAPPAGELSGRLPGSKGVLAVIVGPEGGFSEAERRALAERCSSTLCLGSRVLRVETAAAVGCAWCSPGSRRCRGVASVGQERSRFDSRAPPSLRLIVGSFPSAARLPVSPGGHKSILCSPLRKSLRPWLSSGSAVIESTTSFAVHRASGESREHWRRLRGACPARFLLAISLPMGAASADAGSMTRLKAK